MYQQMLGVGQSPSGGFLAPRTQPDKRQAGATGLAGAAGLAGVTGAAGVTKGAAGAAVPSSATSEEERHTLVKTHVGTGMHRND